MTIKNLEQYRQLQKEIYNLNKRLETLKKSYVHSTVKGSSCIIPYQEKIINVTGIAPKSLNKHNELVKILEDRANRLQDNAIEIEKFIDTVERSEIRQLIQYHYIQGLSWLVTARKVYGYPCEDRARKAITRFFAKI